MQSRESKGELTREGGGKREEFNNTVEDARGTRAAFVVQLSRFRGLPGDHLLLA